MKKFALLSLLVFASCTRAVTPDMLTRVGGLKTSAKLGTESSEFAEADTPQTEQSTIGEGTSEQANTASVRDRIRVELDQADGTAPTVLFLDAPGRIPWKWIPTIPVRDDGYFVASWVSSDGIEQKSLRDFDIKDDSVFKAVWKKAKPLRVELHLNGGVSEQKLDIMAISPKNTIIVFSDEVLYFEAECGHKFSEYVIGDPMVHPCWPTEASHKGARNTWDKIVSSYSIAFEDSTIEVEMAGYGTICEKDWTIPAREEGGDVVVTCQWKYPW